MIQRIFSALVLILAGATGAILLWPGLFPDIDLPAFLAEAPLQRTLLGAIVSFATGAVLLGLAAGGLRRRKEPAYPTYVVDEPAEPASRPLVAPETPPPAEAGPTLSSIMAERTWAPLPPLREPAPPAIQQAEPEAPAEAPAANDAEPQVQEPQAEPESHEAEPQAETPEAEAPPQPEPVAEPEEIEPALDEPAAAPPVDHRARLAELTLAADEAKAAGRADDAFNLYEDAVAEARALHAAGPNDPQAQASLAEAVGRVALMNEAENRLDLALQQHEETLSLYRGLALRQSGEADTPDERRAVEGLVASMERLADCREARGHRSRARDLYGEAVRISQRLTWLEPNSPAYAAAYARAKTRFAALDAELQGEGSP